MPRAGERLNPSTRKVKNIIGDFVLTERQGASVSFRNPNVSAAPAASIRQRMIFRRHPPGLFIKLVIAEFFRIDPEDLIKVLADYDQPGLGKNTGKEPFYLQRRYPIDPVEKDHSILLIVQEIRGPCRVDLIDDLFFFFFDIIDREDRSSFGCILPLICEKYMGVIHQVVSVKIRIIL